MTIKKQLIRALKKHRKIFLIVKALKFIYDSSIRKIDGSKKKYPKVIQLPITYICNSRCVMCNIWKMDRSNEMTLDEFSNFLKDPIFKKVEFVGINGGEPSLIRNLPEYINEVIKLPNIKALNIISHGFHTTRLLRFVELIYTMCQNKGISFHVSISLDGFGVIHDTVRGIPKAFYKTTSTIDKIIDSQHKYCDSYDVGCTIVKQNISYLMELDAYAKRKNYNIKYRLGIENKRIESDKLVDQFSVIYSPLRQSAKEFFHYQTSQSKEIVNKFKFYAIFLWLNASKPKRLLGCSWKDEGITLDARGELYYCAVASKTLGSLREKKGEEVFFGDKNIEYRKSIIENNCDDCIHDYNGKLEFRNVWKFLSDTIKERYAMNNYEIKARFMR